MNYKKIAKRLLALTTIFIVFFTCSCQKKNLTEQKEKLSVVTTIFPLYDFAKAVAGDDAEIILLTQPGVDSHSFEPKSTDMIKISECDIFVYTGKHMEIWAEKLISSVATENSVICDTSKGIELEYKENHSHNHSVDPHIWTGIKNAEIMVKNICDAFCKADEKNSGKYQKNTEEYIKELQNLDNEFKTAFSEIEDKTLVFTSRFPFYYFAKAYNINYLSAFDSCNAETEPDIKSMASLIERIKKENIKTVFYTELSDKKITDAVTTQTGATAKLFHSCHNVTKEEFEKNETYLSLMKNNLKALEGLK